MRLIKRPVAWIFTSGSGLWLVIKYGADWMGRASFFGDVRDKAFPVVRDWIWPMMTTEHLAWTLFVAGLASLAWTHFGHWIKFSLRDLAGLPPKAAESRPITPAPARVAADDGSETSRWGRQIEAMRAELDAFRLKLRQSGETPTGYRELGEVRQEFRDVTESVASLQRHSDLISEAAKLLLLTQIKSVRVLSVESLVKGSPRRLAESEMADAAAVATFVRQAEAYTKEVRNLAPFWGFASVEEIDRMLSRATSDAEEAFEAAHRGRSMDASTFGTLRRYTIALARVEALDRGLDNTLRGDLIGDGGLLTEMRELYAVLEKRRLTGS